MIKENILEKYLLILLIALLPTQLAIHFWPPWAFVYGLRIDFLAPAIYLTDILIFILIARHHRLFNTYKWLFLATVLFGIINIIFSTHLLESSYKWLKVIEFVFLALYIKEQKLLSEYSIIKILLFSSAFFSVIGILQFVEGKTIGGFLYFLGERTFRISTPGIALVSLKGVDYLRAYSTFPHPNSLAGFLGVVLLLFFGPLGKDAYRNLASLFIFTCFILTFSVSSYLGFLLALFFIIIYKRPNIFKGAIFGFFALALLGSLILPLASSAIFKSMSLSSNITERLDLAFISGKMISLVFLQGLGLGTFILNMPLFKTSWSHLWLLQPVHNIFLLIFTETGIVGLLVACLGFYRLFIKQFSVKKYYLSIALVFVIFTGLLDHYWLTLQQNQLLLSLLIGMSLM